MKCDDCKKESKSLVTEIREKEREWSAKKNGICFKCKSKLGFKSLREIDNEIRKTKQESKNAK